MKTMKNMKTMKTMRTMETMKTMESDELEVYSRLSGSSCCSLRKLVQDYRNGTGEFFVPTAEIKLMMNIK